MSKRRTSSLPNFKLLSEQLTSKQLGPTLNETKASQLSIRRQRLSGDVSPNRRVAEPSDDSPFVPLADLSTNPPDDHPDDLPDHLSIDLVLHLAPPPAPVHHHNKRRRYRMPAKCSKVVSQTRVDIHEPRVISTQLSFVAVEERESIRPSLVQFYENADTKAHHPVNKWQGMAILLPDQSGKIRIIGDPETVASLNSENTRVVFGDNNIRFGHEPDPVNVFSFSDFVDETQKARTFVKNNRY
ncbi:hypothetical protein RCL1_000395 [Eukaryota sp. TZLM3-RCL]